MKSIFEEMGGMYRQEGDYLLPNLDVPEAVSLGIWGQRHRRYLREHRSGTYIGLLLSEMLDSHLADIDKQAQAMMEQLMQQRLLPRVSRRN